MPAADGAFELRRPVFARLFGTISQAALSAVGLGLLGGLLVALAATPSFGWYQLLLVPVALAWLRGLTAWCRVDEEGIHSRFWVRRDLAWSDVTQVALRRIPGWSSNRTSGIPAVVVSTAGRPDVVLAPAQRCGRGRREFGTALVAAATAHGRRAVVRDFGWDEAP